MRLPLTCRLALLLAACGPKSDADSDTESGTAANTDDSADTADSPGSDTGDSPTATSDDPPTSTATPTGGETCEDPTVPVGPAVTIKIHNASATSRRYVDAQFACESVAPFQLTGPGDTPVKVDLDTFEFLCSEVDGNDSCGRDPGCPVAGLVVQIDPGATLTLPWSGGSLVEADLFPGCADQFCGGCFIPEQVPAGAYTIEVRHSDGVGQCNRDLCNFCSADRDGLCVAEGVRVDTTIATAILNYPGETDIVVVLE